MATVTITRLIDDIDGTTIPEGHGRTVTFSIDTGKYAIDLNDTNIQRLKGALAPFVDAATPIDPSKSGSAGPDPAAVREWARAQGIPVEPKGRIAKSTLSAYRRAHQP